MQKIRSLASRLATSNTAILILGEHGTGKWDLARHIHQQSPSASGPFSSVDCTSASAEYLVDSVEQAHGGTVFLANVDALDTGLQSLLQEILDGKESRHPRSGGVRANVRLIASAEPELAPTMPPSDLFTRLCRISLFLPPLRERRSDIPILVRHLLDQHASTHDGPPLHFPGDTLVYLWQYDWPGNLRELAEVVRQSAMSAADGIVYPKLLPARIRTSLRQGSPASLRAGNPFEDRRFLRAEGNNDRNRFPLV
jgi:DNA-binding NtrC family response regulator